MIVESLPNARIEPPPYTVATLTSCVAALPATFTVTVID